MTKFTDTCPGVMRTLMNKFTLPDYQAAAIMGNLGHESNGLATLREIGQPEGRGGYGWGQWTGSRRDSFLRFAAANKLDWKSDNANCWYLIHELQGDYKGSISALEKTKNLKDATAAFERNYERAGVIAMASRVSWAKIALDSYRKSTPFTVAAKGTKK
jgi:Phage tail lysozyme